MESLPDDVVHQILQIGTDAKRLNHADLCSLAAVNSRFDQLTQDPTLWATLLSRDFPSYFQFFQDPSKALYREKHEKKREFKRWVKQMCEEFELFWRAVEVDEPDNHSARIFQSRQSNEIFSGSSSQSNIFQRAIQVNSRPQLNTFDPTIGNDLSIFFLHAEADPVLPRASQHSLKQAHNRHYDNRSSKSFDKVTRLKGIPNSKSYIPMNRPPRRSMPRKI